MRLFYSPEKQSPGGVLWKRCSWNFCKLHSKTPVLGLFFKLKQGWRLQIFLLKRRYGHMYFPVHLQKLKGNLVTDHTLVTAAVWRTIILRIIFVGDLLVVKLLRCVSARLLWDFWHMHFLRNFLKCLEIAKSCATSPTFNRNYDCQKQPPEVFCKNRCS